MARSHSSNGEGFTLIEVSLSFGILLPAILLLATFLTQWETRISNAAFSAEFPFLISAIENHLRESTAMDLPRQISVCYGRNGNGENSQKKAEVFLTQIPHMPIVHCDVCGPKGQLSFICLMRPKLQLVDMKIYSE
ncbi:MAG: hypothetical protein LBI34_03025 [Puniceicoccales bacterium]|jgi:hypothetical protein|nr:hypothetical protein [Puniceicoccales bacterium]